MNVPTGLKPEHALATIVVDREVATVKSVKELLARCQFEEKVSVSVGHRGGSGIPAAGTVGEISQSSVYEKLKRRGGPEPTPTGGSNRFANLELLGEGATAKVLSARDVNFDREVALKLLKNANPADVASFLNEAALTAKLEHPNIVPIHDVDLDENGKLYLCMRKIHGRSLKNHIRRQDGGGKDALGGKDIGDLVQILLKLCDALSFAHSRGVFHQDIKPENIMLGAHGEVFLIDWGSAAAADTDISFTPAYMSPEQAKGQEATALCDIYSLGATFFHVLTGRFPLSMEDLERFWLKRGRGEIDLPSGQELALVPPSLMSIILKAMAADPVARYQSIDDLASDLRNYQNGLAVSAYKDSFLQFCGRWHRRNKRTVWPLAGVVSLLVVGGAFLYNLKIKEIAEWGRPTVVETFTDPLAWKRNWIPTDGEWDVEDGRLVTKSGSSFLLFFNQKCYGGTAIEYDAEILPGAKMGDLSTVWCEGDDLRNVDSYYYAQLGANDNTFSRISSRKITLAYSDFTLAPQTRYKIRVEVDDNVIRLFVNGRRICEYISIFPFSEGYIGLFGYYTGKAFDNLRVYGKGVAEKTSIIGIGDAFFSRKLFAQAEREYDKVVNSHKGTMIADEALYKKGLCRMAEGKPDAAFKAWRDMTTPFYRRKALMRQIERDCEKDDHAAAMRGAEELYPTLDGHEKQELVALWGTMVGKVFAERGGDRKAVLDYLRLAEKLFKGTNAYRFDVAFFYSKLGENEHVLATYPEQKQRCSRALLGLGRYEELLGKYPTIWGSCGSALLSMGRFDELFNNQMYEFLYPEALTASGRMLEVLEKHPRDSVGCATALLCLEKEQEVLRKYPKCANECFLAMLYLGRQREAVEVYANNTPSRLSAEAMIAIDEFSQGSRPKALERIDAMRRNFAERCLPLAGFHYLLLPPFLRFFKDGDRKAVAVDLEAGMRKSAEVEGRKFHYLLGYILGKIDDTAFLAQPTRLGVQSRLLLAKALRAEYNGDRAAALAAYRSHAQTPRHQKGLDPVLDHFVKWRIKELGKGGAK